jgi:hypothetical protein
VEARWRFWWGKRNSLALLIMLEEVRWTYFFILVSGIAMVFHNITKVKVMH